jgi:thioredoxin-related protein
MYKMIGYCDKAQNVDVLDTRNSAYVKEYLYLMLVSRSLCKACQRHTRIVIRTMLTRTGI